MMLTTGSGDEAQKGFKHEWATLVSENGGRMVRGRMQVCNPEKTVIQHARKFHKFASVNLSKADAWTDNIWP